MTGPNRRVGIAAAVAALLSLGGARNEDVSVSAGGARSEPRDPAPLPLGFWRSRTGVTYHPPGAGAGGTPSRRSRLNRSASRSRRRAAKRANRARA